MGTSIVLNPSAPTTGRNAKAQAEINRVMAREKARRAALHALVQGFTSAGLVAVVSNTTANTEDVIDHITECPACGTKFTDASRACHTLEERRRASVHAVHALGFYLFQFYPSTQVRPKQLAEA
jgi:hypothetical protein